MSEPCRALASRVNVHGCVGPQLAAEPKAATARGAPLVTGAGAGAVLPEHEPEAVAERLEAWRPSFRPGSPEAEWVLEQLVVQSLRLDRCRHHEAVVRAEQARRAALCWADDRRAAAEELGAKLSRDPARVARLLAGTTQGCDWLLDRWRALGRAWQTHGSWTREQTALAADLCGTPRALRGAWLDGAAADDPAALVAREVGRLERAQAAVLNELDDAERAAAELGLPLDPSPELDRLRRFEDRCHRRLLQARRELDAARRRVEAQTAPAVTAVDPPADAVPAEPLPAPVEPDAADDDLEIEGEVDSASDDRHERYDDEERIGPARDYERAVLMALFQAEATAETAPPDPAAPPAAPATTPPSPTPRPRSRRAANRQDKPRRPGRRG